MDNSSVKRIGLFPSVVVSMFLLGMTFASPKVEARPVCNVTNSQIAWWGGPGYGYYGGWGYRGPVCGERCWRNRWGNIRCASNCWY